MWETYLFHYLLFGLAFVGVELLMCYGELKQLISDQPIIMFLACVYVVILWPVALVVRFMRND